MHSSAASTGEPTRPVVPSWPSETTQEETVNRRRRYAVHGLEGARYAH